MPIPIAPGECIGMEPGRTQLPRGLRFRPIRFIKPLMWRRRKAEGGRSRRIGGISLFSCFPSGSDFLTGYGMWEVFFGGGAVNDSPVILLFTSAVPCRTLF